MKKLNYVKTFENFATETIQFRDHSGSKSDSLSTQKNYTREELQAHIDDLYPENDGFIITEYGREYMVKVKMNDQYYPAGFSDSKFRDDE